MPVTTSYFIATMPRSGGHLLCEALERTGLAGLPTEYFEPDTERTWHESLGASGDADYFRKVLARRSTPNGVFGNKIIWPQFELLKPRLRPIHGNDLPDLELLKCAFPDLRFIWLKRRDKVRQAVSYYKAIWTEVWHWVGEDRKLGRPAPPKAPPRPVPFAFQHIDNYFYYFTESEEKWGRYFARLGIEPFEVVYEDFTRAYESTVVDVLRYLNIDVPADMKIWPPRLQKLGDTTTDDWVERYYEIKRSPRTYRKSVNQSYLISSTPRTGSHLLSRALESTVIAGVPNEYFDAQHESYWLRTLEVSADFEYFDKILQAGTSSNGIFGAKVHWHQLVHLMSKIRGSRGGGGTDIELLRGMFPRLRHVFLTRRDKVRQAVSYYKAIKTGVWWSTQSQPNGNREDAPPIPEFDFEEIDRWVRQLTSQEEDWRRFFARAGVEPFEVVYEDFVGTYDETVCAILDYLELPTSRGFPIPPPRLLKQADEVSEEWVRRYHEIKSAPRAARRPLNLSYFIAGTPRTGSGLLAEALESTRIAGRPKEYYDPNFEERWLRELGISADSEYLKKMLLAGTTSNGVYGAKVHWHQFVHLTTKLRQLKPGGLPDLENLRAAFPELRYVFLTRRDKVRQAVSYYKAIKTGIWFSIRPDEKASQPPPVPREIVVPIFDFYRIDHWVNHLTEFETNWRKYFAKSGLKPFEVSYEDFVENYDATVFAILEYLGIPIPEGQRVAPPRLQKMADDLSEDWVHRYRHLKRV
jgi:LPS sulfotransferase NodH